MIHPALRIPILAAGLCLYLAAILVPCVAGALRAVIDWQSPPGGYLLSARQVSLLAHTLLLALGGAGAAILLALPGAYVFGRSGLFGTPRHARADPSFFRTALRTGVALLLCIPLLLPPMIIAFGWQRLLGPITSAFQPWSPMIACVAVWAFWSWPVPALIIASGWARTGRRAYEAALLDTGRLAAFSRAVIPVLRRHVGVSALILLIVFLGEYTVPHANGLTVVATELLVTAQSATVGACLRQSLPMTASVIILLSIAWHFRPPTVPDDSDDRPLNLPQTRRSQWATALLLLMVAATCAIPIGALACRRTLFADIAIAVQTYRCEFLGTFGVCLATAAAVTCLGVATVNTLFVPLPAAPSHPALAASLRRGVSRLIIVTVALAAVLPGALIGEAVIAAYQFIPPVYDHWPILVIALTARYAWLGLLAAWLAAAVPPRLLDQASVDGADRNAARAAVQWRAHWPALLAGACIAASLALSDVAVVAMVQVPTPRMLATILMEKFHRFETRMLVAISLCMVASILPGAILILLQARWRRALPP